LSVEWTISPNERLQQLLHPWTSYLIVPLFALANAGLEINSAALRHAATSPITLGIVLGYVVGKPVGIVSATWLPSRARSGSLRRPVGWPTLIAGGTIAGIGFTVSLLIASLAFHGQRLADAKIGILASAVLASLVGWLAFKVVARLPEAARIRGLASTAA